MPVKNLQISIIVAIILVISAATAFFFIAAPQQRAETVETVITRGAETFETQPQARLVTFTLYLSDYGFNASRGGPDLIVKQGERVRLTLIGNGSGPIVHDFVLDKDSPSPYDVRSDRLSRGQVQVIEFLAEHPGSFKYYWSVKPPYGLSHRERGQEGTIIISES